MYSYGEGYTCPRSWYRVNELLASELSEDVQQEVFSGAIGQTASVQFVTHCRHAAQSLDLHAIVNRGGKWHFPKEKDPGLRWAFTYGVAALATTKTLGRVFEIANDLHGQGHSEYGMLVGQQAIAKGSFGERLGLTQAEMAKRLGKNRITVIRYESGETPVPKAVEMALKVLRRRRSRSPSCGWPHPTSPTYYVWFAIRVTHA